MNAANDFIHSIEEFSRETQRELIQDRINFLRTAILDNERVLRYYQTAMIAMNNEILRIGRNNRGAQPLIDALNYFTHEYDEWSETNRDNRNEIEEIENYRDILL